MYLRLARAQREAGVGFVGWGKPAHPNISDYLKGTFFILNHYAKRVQVLACGYCGEMVVLGCSLRAQALPPTYASQRTEEAVGGL